MMKYMYILVLFITGIFLYTTVVTTVDWIAIPTVAFNYEHKCLWIQVPGKNGIDKRRCPAKLPKRYNWYFTNGE